MTGWLRYAAMATFAILAWVVRGASPTGAWAATIGLIVVGFVFAFSETAAARLTFLGLAAFCAATITVAWFVRDIRTGADLGRGLTEGLAAFLAVGVPVAVVGRLLPLIGEINLVAVLLNRYGQTPPRVTVWAVAMSAVYGVPVAVATGILISLAVGGLLGFAVGVIAGALAGVAAAQLGLGAGIWSAELPQGQVELTERSAFLGRAGQASADISSIMIAAIATIVLGVSDVAEFSLSLLAEITAVLLVTVGLGGVIRRILVGAAEGAHFPGAIGAMKIVVLPLGAGLGIILGLFASANLLDTVDWAGRDSVEWILVIMLAVTAVGYFLGRLGAAVGLAIGATFALFASDELLTGLIEDWAAGPRALGLGVAGMIGGIVVFELVDGYLTIAGSRQNGLIGLEAVVLLGGSAAAVILGSSAGISAL